MLCVPRTKSKVIILNLLIEDLIFMDGDIQILVSIYLKTNHGKSRNKNWGQFVFASIAFLIKTPLI
jgi:hypothetical protein